MKRLFVFFIFFAVILLGCGPHGEWMLTIYHTGDVHGYAMAYGEETIGYGKTASFVKRERLKNNNSLFFDVGDFFYGTPAADMEKGGTAFDVINLMGYDAVTLGNADFVWGGKQVEDIFAKAKFPVVCANLYYKDKRIYPPYIIKKINGVRFAISGLAPLNAQVATLPSQMEEYQIKNPIEELKSIINEMSSKSDVIILLAHIGKMDPDVNIEKLVNEVSGIDIIIDGHDHARLENGQKINDTFVVNAGEYNKWLGELTVKFNGKKIINESAVLYDKSFFANLDPDIEIETIVRNNHERIETMLGEVVAEAPFYMEGRREFVRTSQTNLGSIYADAERELSKADIAFTVGAFLRDSIDAGSITRSKIMTVLPFYHPLVTRVMAGRQIIDFIEHNYYDNMRDPKVFSGGYAHVSGITWTVDFSRPEGQRMTNILVNGSPIDLEKEYTVACNEQISDYNIRDIPIKERIPVAMADIFIEYLNKYPELAPPAARVSIINR